MLIGFVVFGLYLLRNNETATSVIFGLAVNLAESSDVANIKNVIIDYIATHDEEFFSCFYSFGSFWRQWDIWSVTHFYGDIRISNHFGWKISDWLRFNFILKLAQIECSTKTAIGIFHFSEGASNISDFIRELWRGRSKWAVKQYNDLGAFQKFQTGVGNIGAFLSSLGGTLCGMSTLHSGVGQNLANSYVGFRSLGGLFSCNGIISCSISSSLSGLSSSAHKPHLPPSKYKKTDCANGLKPSRKIPPILGIIVIILYVVGAAFGGYFGGGLFDRGFKWVGVGIMLLGGSFSLGSLLLLRAWSLGAFACAV